MRIPHLTIVEATAEEGPVVSDEALADRLQFAMRFLQSEGYDQYELTHFALPGHRSAHQEHYYAHGNYLGLGPAAESFWWIQREEGSAARRWKNVSDLDQYASLLDGRYPPVAFRRTLNRAELAHEYVLLRLRTSEGLDLNVLDRRYGVDLYSSRINLLNRLQEEGLILVDGHTLRLTNRGRLVADAVTKQLLPSS
jgi:oxygen-independent coproporphyrinogen-3 oxidase